MEMLPSRFFFDFTPVNACLTGAEISDSPSTTAKTAWPENPAPESDTPPANGVLTGADLVSLMRIIPVLAGREPVWYNRVIIKTPNDMTASTVEAARGGAFYRAYPPFRESGQVRQET